MLINFLHILRNAFSRTPIEPTVGTAVPPIETPGAVDPIAPPATGAVAQPTLLERLGQIGANRPVADDIDAQPDPLGELTGAVQQMAVENELNQGFKEMQAVIPDFSQTNFDKVALGIGKEAILSGNVQWGEIATILSKANTEQIEKNQQERKETLSGAHTEGASRGTPPAQTQVPRTPAEGRASAKKFLGL